MITNVAALGERIPDLAAAIRQTLSRNQALGVSESLPTQVHKSIRTMDASALIDRYCKVWSEPDAGNRAELLASVWASHATYTDPSVHAANAQELLSHIAKVHAGRPGVTVVRTSKVDTHHGLARFAWRVVQADGTALPEGLDIALIAPDGTKIERIIGFFGPLVSDAAT